MAETGKKRAQSRRQRLCGAVVLLCVFLQMLAGTVAWAETEINTAESTEGSALRIAVASDLHLDPDNTDKSPALGCQAAGSGNAPPYRRSGQRRQTASA